MTDAPSQPPGWYYAQGDPPGTQRYWDGVQWQGGPQPVPGAGGPTPGGATMVGGEPLASPGKRILARIIDGVIWVVFSVIVGAILGAGAIASGGFTDDSVGTGTTIFAGLVGLILIVAYEVFMVANLGGTVGKLVLGMKVRNQDGSPADLNTAGMRIALYAGLGILQLIPLIGILAGLATLIIGIVGLVLLFTDDRRQTPWDKIGKTVVVDA